MFDHAKQPAEQPCHDPTGHELVVQRLPVVLATPQLPVHADDVDEDHEVQNADQDEESAGHERAYRSADVPKLPVVSHHTLDERLDRKPKGNRDQQDDGGMTQREKEPDTDRLLSALQQLARRVVDRRDVVGVERVAKAERVRQAAEREERWM